MELIGALDAASRHQLVDLPTCAHPQVAAAQHPVDARILRAQSTRLLGITPGMSRRPCACVAARRAAVAARAAHTAAASSDWKRMTVTSSESAGMTPILSGLRRLSASRCSINAVPSAA